MKRAYIIPAITIIAVAPTLPLAESLQVHSEKVGDSNEIMSRGNRNSDSDWDDD